MKVMCIKDFENADGFEPSVGEVVTVLRECDVHPRAWILVEYPKNAKGVKQSFAKEYFAPLSDIDETVIAKQREYETA